MAYFLSPLGNEQHFIDASGRPLSGYKLFAYLAGTTTKTTTWKDNGGLTANANPIVLGSDGRAADPIWLVGSVPVKFVLAPAGDSDPPTSPVWSIDNVVGINDVTTATTLEWQVGTTPTFVDATNFTLTGDQRTTYQVNRRVRATLGGSTLYGTISAVAYTTLTTVTVVWDTGSLDSSLAAVAYNIQAPNNVGLPAGNIWGDHVLKGNTYLEKGIGPREKQNYGFTVSASAQALTIALKTQAGNDPSAAVPLGIPFRSATLTSGTYNTRAVTAAVSLVVPQGATLGFTNAMTSYLDVYALDNAGTVELAVVHLSGEADYLLLDEGPVYSTTVISTGSDSGGTLYSTAARSNVPITWLGRFKVQTGPTAGDWANAPTFLTVEPPLTPRRILVFTASGLLHVPPGATTLKGFAVGGGAGGRTPGGGNGTDAGGGGGGGGTGEVVFFSVAVTPGTDQTLTIGAGGAANTAGGDTTIGSLVTAKGGSVGSVTGTPTTETAGTGGAVGNAASFGTATNGGTAGKTADDGYGGAGGAGATANDGGGGGGTGGRSAFGHGGNGGNGGTGSASNGSAGGNATGYGGGGGGGGGGGKNSNTTGGTGGTGTGGLAWVWFE
jgi:hypothetical protein